MIIWACTVSRYYQHNGLGKLTHAAAGVRIRDSICGASMDLCGVARCRNARVSISLARFLQ